MNSKIVVALDGRKMKDKQTIHQYLAQKFRFPDYYGNNLDALYDLLSVYHDDDILHIVIIYLEEMLELSGQYGQSLMNTFQDVALQNDRIRLYF